MKKKLLLFLTLFCIFGIHQNVKGQTTLGPGDIAFIGFDIGGLDGFSFIALKNLPAGEVVYFTEEGLSANGWIGSGEPHIRWTIPSGVTCGKIISVIETATNNVFTVTGGSTADFVINPEGPVYSFNLAAGDQMLAYQSIGNAMRPTISPVTITFLAGVHGDYNASNYDGTTKWNNSLETNYLGGSESILPQGLTNGVNCVSLFPGGPEPSQYYAKYSGTLTGTATQIRTSINTYTNWTFTSTTTNPSGTQGILPSNYTPNVTCTSVPTATTNTSVTNFGAHTATLGGTNDNGGDTSVLDRGIVWSLTTNPVIGGIGVTKVAATLNGTGSFTVNATGLPAGTTIYYRAYTQNSVETSYGSTVSFTTNVALSATQSQTIACNGISNGTATVVPSGGKTPYTYLWSPSGGTGATASGLSPTNYTVTITDNEGTSIQKNFTITQNSVIITGVTITDVSCYGGNNGSIDISPTGGSGSYTYNWGAGITTQDRTNLTAGTYSVTITDTNNCNSIINNITVGQPVAPLNVLTGGGNTNVSCNGGANGTATVAPTGGTPTYTYSWNTTPAQTTATATGLSAGTYTVTVTDANACQATRTFTINQPTVLSAVTSKTNVSCNGGANGSATVNVTGGTPGYSYSWAPSGGTAATATGLAAGTYTVTVKDANNCLVSNQVIITEPTTLSVGDPTVFGDNVWNFYAWNSGPNIENSWNSNYAGFYVINELNFDTRSQWSTHNSPSSAQGYQGCTVDVNYFSWSAKRSGFTSGYYSVAVNALDDIGELWINGTKVWFQTNCCLNSSNNQVWSGYLCEDSTIELRGYDEIDPAYAKLDFTFLPLDIQTTISNLSCYGENNGTASVNIENNVSYYFNLLMNQIDNSHPIAPHEIDGIYDLISNFLNSLNTVTYTWNTTPPQTGPTATNLSAGEHNVIISFANGCTETKSFTISQPPALIATEGGQTNVSCNGGANGTATVNVTGGTGNYTYSWAPSGGTAATATGLATGTYTVTVTDANSCSTTQSFTITQPPALIATAAAQSNVSCNGGANGTATVNVTGGTGNYTYSWFPSGGTAATATGLSAGTYTVTVTDVNSCSSTQSFTITQPPVLIATAGGQTNVSCNGGANGTATVNVTGGTPGYTYSWAPSGGTAATATGLSAGNYTVTVTDANSCQTTRSFTIGQPNTALNTLAVGQNNASCYGGTNGTATVVATGGTPGYTYSWNTTPVQWTATATGLAAGTYTVTVTDANNCEATRSFTITQPSALIATVGAQTNVSCNGGANGTATVNVTGGTPGYTYSWAPSGGTAATASGLAAGTYTVTVTDANSCSKTQSFTITQPSILSATKSHTNVLCNGTATGSATVVASGGSGTYTYSWSPSGGTAATATGLVVGNYSCVITDSNGCTITETFTINQPSVLTAITSQINATCTTGGEATVNPSGGESDYQYFWTPGGATTATITNLTAGNYSCLITDANGCSITKNFTINTTNTLVASTSKTDVTCNGKNTGSATVIPSGAVGPFTYVWSPTGGNGDTATNLAAGNYSVTITAGNGCSIVKNFTINEPPAIEITKISQTNVSCNGGTNGSATVNVTGGTGVYIYSWAPSGGNAATATGLAAGTYTVTVTDSNLCTKTETFIITQPDAFIATTTKTDVSCNGGTNGTATVNVTGGTGTYTYLWSPSGGTAATASGLTSGNYTVTIKDSNLCQTTATVIVDEPTLLTATINKTDVLCFQANNGTASVTASGGTEPYTYLWSPSGGNSATASGLALGSYDVKITDANGCFITKNIVITEPSIVLPPTVTAQTFCFAENKTIADLVATGTNLKWYDAATGGNPLDVTTVLTTKSYFVSQTVANCESERTEVVVTITPNPNAPTVTAQTFCFAENKTIADLVATGTNLKWYDAATGGNPLDVTTVLTTKSYFVSQTVANCESERTEVVVTITPNPNAPTVTAQTFCFAENKTIADLVATGTNLKWYDAATGGNPLDVTTVLTTKSYFVSQTISNCESERTEVIVTITPNPNAPTVTAQTFCFAENKTIADLVATGTNLKWYDAATGGNPLDVTTVLTTKSYFVSQTVANCESERIEVVVTITPNPNAPTANAPTFCFAENKTIADLVATGTNLKWYDEATGGNTLAPTTVLTSKSYFVSQTVSNCESERTEVIITITPNPMAPTATAQTFCFAENKTIADLVATGTNLKWYDVATGGNALPSTTVLTTKSYFVSQTVSNCESERTEVIVTITPNPIAPTANAIQEFCSNTNSKISNIEISGSNIKWYASINSTTELNENTYLTNASTYFATQTINGCESELRTQVTVQISTPPTLPTGDSIQTFCGNATIADLQINAIAGAELIWYTTSYSNTILPTSTALANATYYVAQKVGACISERKAVTARIINLSSPNIGNFEFCGSAQVSDLYIPTPTGVTYKWYNSPSNPNELQPYDSLTTGTYFVSKSQYNCETARAAVSVVIKDLPESPTGISPQSFVEGSVINQILINPTTAVWYITENDAITSTNPLSPNMPLVNGTTYYAVNIGTNGCPSLPFAVTVDVYLSNDAFEMDKLKYYPNPVNDKLNIVYFENIIQVDVFDLTGRNVKSVFTNSQNIEVDLSDLSSATYMIQLKTESKQQFIKIIKN
ncbi:T9SS type A sorting domain-containing protein [Flavobacterium sp. I3-2]|uniref:Ig-like domain-containing protein n=1 Tax=Flavobacterium sp. I3-2 TaxID=2748319 RepID=UPI0015AEA897|nr:T9SS type A sorting domain-containing protein [Flavobacterium sp. I3-2]